MASPFYATDAVQVGGGVGGRHRLLRVSAPRTKPRRHTMKRMLIRACTSLVVPAILACASASESGMGEPRDAGSSMDLDWAVPNPNAPRLGEPAPVLSFEETINGSADGDTAWAGLEGKATVLEFWATWCAPCVQVIPHLNELADDLSEHDIRFISVTDEEERIVASFLESIPISGLVGLDLDRSVFTDYGIQSIPATFLVDREGVIQAVTNAHELTREHLLDLIAGRRPDVPQRQELDLDEFFKIGDSGPEAVFQVFVRPSTRTEEESGMSRSPREIRLIGYSPETMLQVAYGVGAGRLLMEAELSDQKYDVVVNTNGRSELLDPLFRQAVAAALGIEATWEERVVDVQVLLATDEAELEPLGPSDGRSLGYRTSPGSLVATDLQGLVDTAASLLKRPVLNETGLTGRYRIDLKFDLEEDPASLGRAIQETLGLELASAERPVEMLVVREYLENDTRSRTYMVRRTGG